MTPTATLSGKFQISIPKAVREAQHWQAGQEFVFIPRCRSSNNMGSHTERRNHQIFLKRCGSYLTASYYYRK